MTPHNCHAKIDIPVTLWDERLTSVEARDILREDGLGESSFSFQLSVQTSNIYCIMYRSSSSSSGEFVSSNLISYVFFSGFRGLNHENFCKQTSTMRG